jgi:hypothetical protein
MASERKRQETQLAHGLGYVPGVTDDGVTGRLADVEVLFKSVVKSWSESVAPLSPSLFAMSHHHTPYAVCPLCPHTPRDPSQEQMLLVGTSES